MAIVFLYAVFGGMKGITYTQVAQYTLILACHRFPPSSHLHAPDRRLPAATGPGRQPDRVIDMSLLSRILTRW